MQRGRWQCRAEAPQGKHLVWMRIRLRMVQSKQSILGIKGHGHVLLSCMLLLCALATGKSPSSLRCNEHMAAYLLVSKSRLLLGESVHLLFPHTILAIPRIPYLIFSPACSAESNLRRNSLLAFCRRARALTSRCAGAARRLASSRGGTRTQRRGAGGKNLVNLHRARFLRASILCGCMPWPSIFRVHPFHLLKDPCTSIVAWCNIFAKHCKDFETKTSKISRQIPVNFLTCHTNY